MDALFLVTLVGEGLLALGSVLFPAAMYGLLGVELNEIATPFARLYGSALVSFPILLWLARGSKSPEFRKAVVYGLFAYYVVSIVILVMAQTAGLMNALGWIVIAMHTALLGWFGYFLVER
jgi:hypothetical protein